jgi:dTDP-4-amino-4,6-dideoxygalactose transaminase
MSGSQSAGPLGDKPLFKEAKPTCNLYRPDIDTFLEYARTYYRNGQYSNAELCRTLELRLGAFHKVKRVISVTSGFWAHVLAMSALALPGRREIIAPAFGYRRTDDMIAWAGYVPHFCDVNSATLAVTADNVMAELNERTALILAPHPMVNCCDAEGIERLGRRHGIPVVFDSVEAAYRAYNGRRIGGFGDAEGFSMHAPKLLNSFEGGYIATNNMQLADRLDRMKQCGLARAAGHNSRILDASLNEMHAAMALASLDGVDEQIPWHRKNYDLYADGLRNLEGLNLVEHKQTQRPDYRLIVVRISEGWPFPRDETLRRLEAENVLARPYYHSLAEKRVEYERLCPYLPVTSAIASSLMVLPSGAHVSERDVEKIIELLIAIRRIAKEPSSPRKTA